MFSKRHKQQLFGLFLLLLGAVFTAWCWYTALYCGYYYPKASMLFPAFAVVGMGIILFPGYREERIARGEDVTRLSGMKLITLRWWIILIIALMTGGVNWFLLSSI
jgi:ABC-type Fe3+-siderophore transport system permease subunit